MWSEPAQGLVVLASWTTRALALHARDALPWVLSLGDTGALLVGVGALTGASVPRSVGTLWLVADLCARAVDAAPPSAMTAGVTRALGLAVGLRAMGRHGPTPGAWWAAVLGFGALLQATRWLSHWRVNLNGAWGIPPRVLGHMGSLSRFHAASLVAMALVSLAVTHAFERGRDARTRRG